LRGRPTSTHSAGDETCDERNQPLARHEPEHPCALGAERQADADSRACDAQPRMRRPRRARSQSASTQPPRTAEQRDAEPLREQQTSHVRLDRLGRADGDERIDLAKRVRRGAERRLGGSGERTIRFRPANSSMFERCAYGR
jgi:hypothetical protein